MQAEMTQEQMREGLVEEVMRFLDLEPLETSAEDLRRQEEADVSEFMDLGMKYGFLEDGGVMEIVRRDMEWPGYEQALEGLKTGEWTSEGRETFRELLLVVRHEYPSVFTVGLRNMRGFDTRTRRLEELCSDPAFGCESLNGVPAASVVKALYQAVAEAELAKRALAALWSRNPLSDADRAYLVEKCKRMSATA